MLPRTHSSIAQLSFINLLNYNTKKYRCDIPVSAQTEFTKAGTEINIASDKTSKKHYCKMQLNVSSRIMLTQLFYSICHFIFADEKNSRQHTLKEIW